MAVCACEAKRWMSKGRLDSATLQGTLKLVFAQKTVCVQAKASVRNRSFCSLQPSGIRSRFFNSQIKSLLQSVFSAKIQISRCSCFAYSKSKDDHELDGMKRRRF